MCSRCHGEVEDAMAYVRDMGIWLPSLSWSCVSNEISLSLAPSLEWNRTRLAQIKTKQKQLKNILFFNNYNGTKSRKRQTNEATETKHRGDLCNFRQRALSRPSLGDTMVEYFFFKLTSHCSEILTPLSQNTFLYLSNFNFRQDNYSTHIVACFTYFLNVVRW
jgi:hypothetical protein